MQSKGFYKRFFAIYIVFVLQNMVTLGVNLLDNIMIGGYSEISVSGVAAVNQIQFVFQQVLTAFGEGVVMFGSQYWGRKQTDPIKKFSAIGMAAALAVSVMLFIAVSIWPVGAVGLFTTDQMIIAEGVNYLRIIRFSYFFFAVTLLLLATLRSVEIVKIGFALSVMALVINTVLNYTLIYGHFGMPELGVAGAAIGTLTARITEFLGVIIYIALRDRRLHLQLRDYLRIDRVLVADYFRSVIPMVGVSGLWGVSTALQTVILGHMSAAALAANSVASVLFLLVKGGAVGAASAAGVLIGKEIGGGDLTAVKKYAAKLQKLFLAVGIVGGILLFFIRIPILGLYDLAPGTKDLANQFLIILSVIYIGMGYQMPTSEGIIRGGGSALFVVKMNLISIWIIVLPLSWAMAFIFKAPPALVVCCLNADQIFKCVPVFLKANYGEWIRKLTRD